MIGKRKRETVVASRSTKAGDPSPSPPPADNAQDIFRKYFEAQFEPLDLPSRPVNESEPEANDSDSDGDSEVSISDEEGWEGVSEDEPEDNQVEVVEYKDARLDPDARMDKKARKAFMVCISLRGLGISRSQTYTAERKTTILLRAPNEINRQVKRKGRVRRRERRGQSQARPCIATTTPRVTPP